MTSAEAHRVRSTASCLRQARSGRWVVEHLWVLGTVLAPWCRRCGLGLDEAAQEWLDAAYPSVPSEYALLGLKPGCGAAEVRRAYRVAAKQAHPDMGGTNERMAAVNAAWATVSRAEARKEE